MTFSEFKTWTVRIIAIAMSLYHLYTGAFGVFDAVIQRTLHLAFAAALIVLVYPSPWSDGRLGKIFPRVVTTIVFAAAFLPLGYLFFNFEYFTAGRIQFVSDVTLLEGIYGIALILAILELTRRVTGPVLPAITMVFLAFPFIPHLPGVLGHTGYALSESIEIQYLTLAGIFGVPVAASANFVILFIIFGAFLERSGLGAFIIDFTVGLVGRYRGGPAKVAVIASAMTGTISGSAMANVLTTGTLTIPLMRRIGYPAFMAGAIEAAASTGGALMPPIMGNVAFIMAQFSGIPYGLIALYGLIPALLYFLGIFCTVHWSAVRYDVGGLPPEELPDWRQNLKDRGHLILPIFLLIWLMVQGYSPQYSVVYSILAVIVVAALRKTTRMGIKDIFIALENGAKGAVLVAIATACAGMIVGVFELTAVGVKLAQTGNELVGSLFVGLLVTMGVSLILGMGVPPSVSYIAQVAVTIPMLQIFLTGDGMDAETALVVTHFFVMYFATLAVLTPPDALASIAAAGIAKSPVVKTASHATRVAFVAFIVPFMFVYRPGLLMLGTWQEVIVAVGFAIAGIIILSIALEGCFLRPLSWLERVLAFASGLALVAPHLDWNLGGLVVLAVILILQWRPWDLLRR